MSRERDLNKILKYLNAVHNGKTDKEISQSTGLSINKVLQEMKSLEIDQNVILSNQYCVITEKGKTFYKRGGYVAQRIWNKIQIAIIIVTFILAFLTFIIELRGCIKQDKKELELKQASPTI